MNASVVSGCNVFPFGRKFKDNFGYGFTTAFRLIGLVLVRKWNLGN